MFAVVDDRNQQYRVKPGDRIQIHLLKDLAEGAKLTFDKICVVGGDGEGRVGSPYVAGVSVTATVVRNEVKGVKVVIGKFRRRKNSRRRTGFRARYTEIQIETINA
ncbi:MAG: 50S ribosomal protein L21 [Planctomycetota bacterium]|nr:50S ribosomal protein L21 [Planctomycetota bacterium]MSR39318.1 50S ribosomal protein L21 [Planctomycetota bacterium]